jgi:hypothetical protein
MALSEADKRLIEAITDNIGGVQKEVSSLREGVGNELKTLSTQVAGLAVSVENHSSQNVELFSRLKDNEHRTTKLEAHHEHCQKDREEEKAAQPATMQNRIMIATIVVTLIIALAGWAKDYFPKPHSYRDMKEETKHEHRENNSKR